MLEAFPLCPGVVPVVGTLCNAVSGAAGNVTGSVAGAGIGAIFTEAARWVASGAVWLIAQVGRAMSGTTSIDLDAGWFRAHESVMAGLAAAVVLPMACCAAIQAIYRQSASTLLRTFLVHLPLSLLLTGVAVTLVRMALAVTDAMSAKVLASAGVDTTNLFTGLFKFLIPSAVVTAGAVPGFVVFLGSLVVSLAALTLWLELVVRAAAVSVAVLFLPLALAALVWPPIAHWCRRLADTLVALVLSKFVVAAVLSLAASAGAGGLGVSSSGNGGQFASVVTGIALLLIAILAPFTLLRLVPAVEAGAVAHLESTRHRVKSVVATPVNNGRNLAAELAKKAGAKSETAGAVGTTGSTGSAGAAAAAGAVGTAGAAAAAGAVGTAGATGAAGMTGAAESGGGTAVSWTRGDPAAHLAFSRIRPEGGAAVDGEGSHQPGSSSPGPETSRPPAGDTTDRSTRE